eukprot:2147192-Pleurochrysis_carterae.AAC.1
MVPRAAATWNAQVRSSSTLIIAPASARSTQQHLARMTGLTDHSASPGRVSRLRLRRRRRPDTGRAHVLGTAQSRKGAQTRRFDKPSQRVAHPTGKGKTAKKVRTEKSSRKKKAPSEEAKGGRPSRTGSRKRGRKE